MLNKSFYKVIVVLILVITILIFIAPSYFYFDDIDPVLRKGDVEWAGHNFRIASSGNVIFTDSGYEVTGNSNSDDGLVTSKLTDINLNQKIKIKITADMTGEYVNGEWSEFAIYIASAEDRFFDNKAGIALMGSRDNVAQSDAPNAGENVRNTFSFTWFTVENTGNEIIFEDSNGRIIREGRETHKGSSQNVFDLNPNEEWNLRINSHVKGKGSTKLFIRKIEVLQENINL